MWLFTRYGFFSVSAQGDRFAVRARMRRHLDALRSAFPAHLGGAEIIVTPNADYRYRLIADRKTWEEVVVMLVREQTWPNFKNEAARMNGHDAYVNALHEVWSTMNATQEEDQRQQTAASTEAREAGNGSSEMRPPAMLWDGVTRPETLSSEIAAARQALAEYARQYDWPKVRGLLSERPKLINSTRPGGRSLYAPLHQAAHGGADIEVVSALIKLGAWRSLRDSRGNRPLDIARMQGRRHLEEILEPVCRKSVGRHELARLQDHFHQVIRGRVDQLVREHSLRLPELEVMLEFPDREFWFPVPGMYGGFSYWLSFDPPPVKLISESWCRVAGGSGERHEITETGSSLVEEGF